MTIPIRNLYYLFCYAWGYFPDRDTVDVGIDECPDIPNLLAKVLITGSHRLLRKGLDRGYHPVTDETRSPRGRLLIDRIVKEQTLRRGAVVSSYDELTPDVLHNQILKATADRLSRVVNLTSEYSHELRVLVRRMGDVSNIRLTGGVFRQVQLSRNSGGYVPLIKLCELIFRSTIPGEEGEHTRFADFDEDELIMSSVFEEFLRNFYAYEQREFKVSREWMRWWAESHTDGGAAYLPVMKTDITLRSKNRIIVIDAKFHRSTFDYRDGVPKIKSPNLYQLLAYMQHTALQSFGVPVEGMLIYPATESPVSLQYILFGHHFRLASIDFNRPWHEIHGELLDLLVKRVVSDRAVSAISS